MLQMKGKTFLAGCFAAQDGRTGGLPEAAPDVARGSGMGSILSNGTRASILYMMARSPDTLYSMQVEELASAIGTRPRLVIYHLEKLQAAGLVEVKKARKYGRKERRSIWGLDMSNPARVQRMCALLDDFFGGRVLDARAYYIRQRQQLPV